MKKNFCVIGAQVNRQWDRTWLASEEDAVAHAESIARKSYANNSKPVQLFVVERKKVVEVGMPETVVREPEDKDNSANAEPAEDD